MFNVYPNEIKMNKIWKTCNDMRISSFYRHFRPCLELLNIQFLFQIFVSIFFSRRYIIENLYILTFIIIQLYLVRRIFLPSSRNYILAGRCHWCDDILRSHNGDYIWRNTSNHRTPEHKLDNNNIRIITTYW